MKDFWEYKHTIKNVKSLTGAQYDDTIQFLLLEQYMNPSIKILEVGCGLGYVTEGCSKIGDVSVVDISTVALDRVKDFCEATYLSDDTANLPTDYFDVIICNNVVQHIPDEALNRELEDIIRSLKPGGIFALEFVSSDKDDIEFSTKYAESGFLCRSSHYMHDLISNFGGKSTEVLEKVVNVPPVTGCHVFHITKDV